MSFKLFTLSAAALFVATTGMGHAAPVNGTGLVAPNMIFGGGNLNGGFTGVVQNNIELGLRGKQRYPAAEVYNYDGIDTYTFDSTVLTTNPANRSVFNFEWSINVEGAGNTIGSYDYLLQVDRDPSAGVNFSNPANSVALYDPTVLKDHSFGVVATAQGAGVEATDLATYVTYLANNTVSQQSWNLGFEGFTSGNDASLPGSYRINLQVFAKGTNNVLAATGINVNVLPLPVPEPGSLALVGLALVGLAAMRRRA